jgi:PKD domain
MLRASSQGRYGCHGPKDQQSSAVQLDGSGSTDVDGDLLSYHWSLTAPAGSSAALSSPDLFNPTFLVDKPGTYVGQLIVNDGTVDSAPATVTVTTKNSPPEADAGPDQSVPVGTTVTLDGSATKDADRDPLTYQWALLSVPAKRLSLVVKAVARIAASSRCG